VSEEDETTPEEVLVMTRDRQRATLESGPCVNFRPRLRVAGFPALFANGLMLGSGSGQPGTVSTPDRSRLS